MPIYALGEQVPDIHPEAFVHPDAVVIGSVTIGAQSSIWPGAVLRGDDGEIHIGARTSIQDNCVLHTTPMHPTIVGDDCVVGHIVHLEGWHLKLQPCGTVEVTDPHGRVRTSDPPGHARAA